MAAEALKPKELGYKKFGAKGLWDQGTGKAGEKWSRMDLGSRWVSHIHTLRVETGH